MYLNPRLTARALQEWLEGDGNYLAPELLTSEEPTFAADIYSAGATIFECCTGTGPMSCLAITAWILPHIQCQAGK